MKQSGRTNEISLSKRQYEIFNQILEGKTSAKISEDLSISQRTCETYVAQLFDKFDCSSRRELIIKYYQEELTVKVNFEILTKRKKIENLLPIHSDSQIAKIVGCTYAYANTIRNQLRRSATRNTRLSL